MKKAIEQLLRERDVLLCAPIPLSSCHVVRPYLLERVGIQDGTAFLFAVPYYTTKCDDPARNISAYAVAQDYHGFFAALFDEILPILRAQFPQNRFAGFADHAPIAEVDAAARAGLGVRGDNGLLLTEPYSSYVFLGEIVTDASIACELQEPRACVHCGACAANCPASLCKEECLSALTQKKGELTEQEQQRLIDGGTVWGCDRCQEVCPVTRRAKAAGTIYSPIAFFNEDVLPHPSAALIESMSDEAFAARAYSWRGRKTILRNLFLQKGEPT